MKIQAQTTQKFSKQLYLYSSQQRLYPADQSACDIRGHVVITHCRRRVIGQLRRGHARVLACDWSGQSDGVTWGSRAFSLTFWSKARKQPGVAQAWTWRGHGVDMACRWRAVRVLSLFWRARRAFGCSTRKLLACSLLPVLLPCSKSASPVVFQGTCV